MRIIFFIVVMIILLMDMSNATEIKISEATLKDKIGQMVMVRGDDFDDGYLRVGVGGIFLSNLKTKEDYIGTIRKYQGDSKYNLLVATDMEGYWNPFSNFYNSINFGEILDGGEAFEIGRDHGRIMKELGFNLNFSPVVEYRNKVWQGRSFTGNKREINEKIIGYISGLKIEGIMATAKHYPGGSMVKDPHYWKFKTRIYQEDLDLFGVAIDSHIDAVMIGHPIVYGNIDSKGKQSSVSREVIGTLREDFDGLIISDAISMFGLRWSYLFGFDEIYVDLIKAGNDVILDVSRFTTPYKVNKRIERVEKAVNAGEIPENRINESFRRIMEAKGHTVI